MLVLNTEEAGPSSTFAKNSFNMIFGAILREVVNLTGFLCNNNDTNIMYLLSARVLLSLSLSHLTSFQSKCYCVPFTDEETETQRG